MSAGGIFLEIPDPLPLGAAVRVCFPVPDGSGDVVTIDPKTGQGTIFNSFKDPTTNMGISFAGAGVNADVSPTIQ